jgi:hypothetical protein
MLRRKTNTYIVYRYRTSTVRAKDLKELAEILSDTVTAKPNIYRGVLAAVKSCGDVLESMKDIEEDLCLLQHHSTRWDLIRIPPAQTLNGVTTIALAETKLYAVVAIYSIEGCADIRFYKQVPNQTRE